MKAADGTADLRPPVVALASLFTLFAGGCGEAPSSGRAGTDIEQAIQEGARGQEQLASIGDRDAGRDAEEKPPAARTPEDVALGTRVRSALSADPGLSALAIEVNVMDGSVTLYGTADTRERRDKAARVALNVDGVRSVTNHLIVLRGS
jgi:osmotically-inducible protein OsmY